MIEEIGIDLLIMIENAGRNLAALARRMLNDDVSGKKVVVLAGTGNRAGGRATSAQCRRCGEGHPCDVQLEDKSQH